LVDHIPLTRAPVEISTYSSDVYAWKTGNEWLIVARPTSVDQDTYVPITDYFAKITLFLDDFHPQHPNSHRWHLEAIYLEARSRM
jgi:hypothetical protein